MPYILISSLVTLVFIQMNLIMRSFFYCLLFKRQEILITSLNILSGRKTRAVNNGKREKAFLPYFSHPPGALSFFPLPASLSETRRRNIILART